MTSAIGREKLVVFDMGQCMSKSRSHRLFGETGIKVFYKNGDVSYHSVIGEETKNSKSSLPAKSVSEIDEVIQRVSDKIRSKMNESARLKLFGSVLFKIRFRNGVPVFLSIQTEETHRLDNEQGQ